MTDRDVVVVGAGPTGLMLAAELALAGVDVVVIERRPNQDFVGVRARGLLTRSIELLDQRGVAERFISQGQKYPASMFTGARFMADLPTRHNYVLGLFQIHVERTLADWVRELGVPLLYETEVSGFDQNTEGVHVALANGESIRARYLVGCDGGRSLVRKRAGIELVGWDATQSWILAEVEFAEEPKWGFHEDSRGKHAIGKGDGFAGVVLVDAEVRLDDTPTLDDIRESLVAVYGSDFGVRRPRWISRFNDATRQASTYRNRRVLIAGDAAHVHSPVGGQGLNMGMHDAVNLGWKLAQVVKGISPDTLLDTYQAERHPISARVLRTNMAQVALARTDARTRALRETMNEVLALDEPSRQITAMMSGLDHHYDLGAGHPLLGRRMPDLDITTPGGPTRVFTLLHAARPVLINFGEPGGFDIAPWRDRVQLVDARCEGPWELPVVSAVPALSAVLIRPDGHVAWVGEGSGVGLVDAMTAWFGPAGT